MQHWNTVILYLKVIIWLLILDAGGPCHLNFIILSDILRSRGAGQLCTLTLFTNCLDLWNFLSKWDFRVEGVALWIAGWIFLEFQHTQKDLDWAYPKGMWQHYRKCKPNLSWVYELELHLWLFGELSKLFTCLSFCLIFPSVDFVSVRSLFTTVSCHGFYLMYHALFIWCNIEVLM